MKANIDNPAPKPSDPTPPGGPGPQPGPTPPGGPGPQLIAALILLSVFMPCMAQTNLFKNVKTETVTSKDCTVTNKFRAHAWDDLRFPATGINPAGPVAAATPDTTIPGLLFSGSADNMAYIVAQMSHAKKLGTAISPHLHVESTGTSTAQSDWLMMYCWRNIGVATNFVAWTTNSFSYTPSSGVVNSNALVECGADINPPANESVSSLIQIKLERLGNTDANNDDIRLIEFDIHYERDGIGSETEFSKQP